MNYFSMFSGIGGFELGIHRAVGGRPGQPICQLDDSLSDTSSKQPKQIPICVGYSEIDKYAIKVYERHFGNEVNNEYAPISSQSEQEERQSGGVRSANKSELQLHDRNRTTTLRNRGHKNYGDATKINAAELPDFDLLVGGFPCQSFSIAGKRRGFDDTRGTLFFDIARIVAEKRPRHLVLENVKGLLSHDSGKTLQTIFGVLSDLGYRVEWQVLNSKNFGVPQNRERIYIIGHLRGECGGQVLPITGTDPKTIKHSLYEYNHQDNRVRVHDEVAPTVQSSYGMGGGHVPYVAPVLTPDRLEKRQNGRRMKEDGEPAFTVTAQDRHGLYDGMRIRRLTPKECERLQGFPDNWTAGESDTQRYKMCGNAVTVNVVEAVITSLINGECL